MKIRKNKKVELMIKKTFLDLLGDYADWRLGELVLHDFSKPLGATVVQRHSRGSGMIYVPNVFSSCLAHRLVHGNIMIVVFDCMEGGDQSEKS